MRVYSPSYAEEPVAQVFEARLQEAGLAVERQAVPPRPGGPARANLLVRLGPQPPAMLWVGHLDTIEALHGFAPPRVAGDALHGLGAADMKGGCAAMVEAAAPCTGPGCPWPGGCAWAWWWARRSTATAPWP